MRDPKIPVADSPGSSQTARATLLLREMLLKGRFRPGERIREIPLAAQLGVSRIPLRLVLERLAHEGLLEVRRPRGFVVQQFSPADIFDAIELRGALEGTAARLAAERFRDAPDLMRMRELSNEMIMLVRQPKLTLESFTRYINLNAMFHVELLTLSQSRMLRRAMEQACSLPFASPSAFLKQQHVASDSRELFLVAADQHLGIVQAIANGESMRAETLTREHARLARRNLEAALANGDLLQLVPGAKLIKL